MNFLPEQPLSRRAAREARRTTGEQPSLHGDADDLSASTASASLEETGSTGSQQITGPDGQPLTRRRLRELRETGMIPTITAPSAPVAPVVAAEPEPTAEPERAESPAMQATAPQPDAQYFRPSVPVASQPAMQATAPQPELPQPAFVPVTTEFASPPSWTAPEGHWTRQLELDDDLETTVSREVGGASATASMLVVTELPKVVDLGGPLGQTGEMLLTGSISLSPDFAATGAISGLHNEAELDDRFDSTGPATDSSAAPVKASAVASQHALGTPIVAGGKPRTSRALSVLLVTASVLAVLVTGLIVTAIVLRWI